MNVMFFSDLENFRNSISGIDDKLRINYDTVHKRLFSNIIQKMSWEEYNPRLIRGYFYTGTYTKQLVNRIKDHMKDIRRSDKFSVSQKDKICKKITKLLEKTKEKRREQLEELKDIHKCSFLEFKQLPLQYSQKNIRVFQKGVDVQLAVDLVSHAYKDNYDVAILCSGDMDIVESVKLVKLLGKKVIVVSSPQSMSKGMRKECDFYYNLSKLTPNDFSKFCDLAPIEESTPQQSNCTSNN